MTAPLAQDVLRPPARTAIFLTVVIHEGAEAQVRGLLTDLSGLKRTTAFRIPEADLSLVTGIGADAWDRLFDGARRPAHLHPFEALHGVAHSAPATPGDLLFHIRCARADMCFELAKNITDRLKGIADVVDEVHGFRYFDERDLLGFVDGTESPPGPAAEPVVFGDGTDDPPYAASSYVIVQKYLHDLDAWEGLTVEEQEAAIGRHKLSDVEIPDDDKASNSHVALNTIEDADGNQRQIVRDNLPFGRVGSGEFGTYFIGYAADPGTTEEMLRNMFLGRPAGNHDRILDFSTPVTGCLFFVPSADFLDNPAPTLAAL